MSGFGGNAIFSVANQDRAPIFFSMQIPLIDEHLFCKYFVRQFVGQAKKGSKCKCKKHDFLGGYIDRGLILFFCEDLSH